MPAIILSFLQRKAVMYVLLAGVIIALAVLAYKKLFSSNDDLLSSSQKQKKNDEKVGNLTYTDSEYEAFADVIEQNTHHVIWDDDPDKVFEVFAQMRTDGDLNALIVAYGERSRTNAFGYDIGEDMNLPQTISDEFSSAQITRLNQQLAGQGLKYRFV